MHAPGSAGSSGTGSGSVRMLRISGPSDLINGAGQLLAAGARQVQGVKQVLQVCSSDRLPFLCFPLRQCTAGGFVCTCPSGKSSRRTG